MTITFLREQPQQPRMHRAGPTSPLLRALLEDVARRYRIPTTALFERNRTEHACRARQEFMALAYETGRYSYPTIGLFLGRNYTTVMHGVKRHRERVAG